MTSVMFSFDAQMKLLPQQLLSSFFSPTLRSVKNCGSISVPPIRLSPMENGSPRPCSLAPWSKRSYCGRYSSILRQTIKKPSTRLSQRKLLDVLDMHHLKNG